LIHTNVFSWPTTLPTVHGNSACGEHVEMNSTFYKVHVLQENPSRFDCFSMGFKTIVDRL